MAILLPPPSAPLLCSILFLLLIVHFTSVVCSQIYTYNSHLRQKKTTIVSCDLEVTSFSA